MKSLRSKLTDAELFLNDIDKATLIALDKEYGALCREYWLKWDQTDCKNLDAEFEKFMTARKKREKYFPQLQLVKDELSESWLERVKALRKKFVAFRCFLSKYYIESLDLLYAQGNMTVHKDDPVALAIFNQKECLPVSMDAYNYAWDLIKEHPYRDVREKQPFRGRDVLPLMKSHMEKRGFDFKVKLNQYMIARQNVEPHNKTLFIKTDGYFSQLDVESLRIHEIDVHVARRAAGYNLGLYLMVYGLAYRNTLDEGLAINQSLHYNKFGVKPNLEWDIAIKTIIGRHIMDMDFCELFDFLIDKVRTEQNADIIESQVFKNLCRFKRVVQDCSKPGGDSAPETDYLLGYLMIHDMPKSLRTDCLNYNIGPGHLKDLPLIKRFFELNKFEPLT